MIVALNTPVSLPIWLVVLVAIELYAWVLGLMFPSLNIC